MNQRDGTIWQGILHILADGKRHRYAAMADVLGCQVNSIERQVHDLRHGKKPGGAVAIESAPVPGTSFHEAWIERHSAVDPMIDKCKRIRDGYPSDHPQRRQIDMQIAEMEHASK
jgi:hypothetical protein